MDFGMALSCNSSLCDEKMYMCQFCAAFVYFQWIICYDIVMVIRIIRLFFLKHINIYIYIHKYVQITACETLIFVSLQVCLATLCSLSSPCVRSSHQRHRFLRLVEKDIRSFLCPYPQQQQKFFLYMWYIYVYQPKYMYTFAHRTVRIIAEHTSLLNSQIYPIPHTMDNAKTYTILDCVSKAVCTALFTCCILVT